MLKREKGGKLAEGRSNKYGTCEGGAQSLGRCYLRVHRDGRELIGEGMILTHPIEWNPWM